MKIATKSALEAIREAFGSIWGAAKISEEEDVKLDKSLQSVIDGVTKRGQDITSVPLIEAERRRKLAPKGRVNEPKARNMAKGKVQTVSRENDDREQ